MKKDTCNAELSDGFLQLIWKIISSIIIKIIYNVGSYTFKLNNYKFNKSLQVIKLFEVRN